MANKYPIGFMGPFFTGELNLTPFERCKKQDVCPTCGQKTKSIWEELEGMIAQNSKQLNTEAFWRVQIPNNEKKDTE